MSVNSIPNMLLITAGFPYGESERSFLSTEFSLLSRQFNVSVLALNTSEELTHPIADTVAFEKYQAPALRNSHTIRLIPKLLQRPYFCELRGAAVSCSLKTKLVRAGNITAYYLNALYTAEKLREIIVERNIDVIYTYWCSYATLAAVLLRKEFPGLKVVSRFHGVDLYNERCADNYQPCRTLIAGGADLLAFACTVGRDYFVQHWGKAHSAKCVTAYLGCLPFPRVSHGVNDNLVLVSCSYLVPLKRVERIINALALLPEHISIAWHHVGDGPQRATLEDQARTLLTAHSNVDYCFHGSLPNNQLPALYEKLAPHLFITASSTEGGTPVSLQEAASAGIVSIGTDVGGIGEVVLHEKTGFLLSADASAQELADAISAFAALPLHKRLEMSNAAVHLWQLLSMQK